MNYVMGYCPTAALSPFTQKELAMKHGIRFGFQHLFVSGNIIAGAKLQPIPGGIIYLLYV